MWLENGTVKTMISEVFAASLLLKPLADSLPNKLLSLDADSFAFSSLREPKIIFYPDCPQRNANAEPNAPVPPIMAIVFPKSDIKFPSVK